MKICKAISYCSHYMFTLQDWFCFLVGWVLFFFFFWVMWKHRILQNKCIFWLLPLIKFSSNLLSYFNLMLHFHVHHPARSFILSKQVIRTGPIPIFPGLKQNKNKQIFSFQGNSNNSQTICEIKIIWCKIPSSFLSFYSFLSLSFFFTRRASFLLV